MTQIQMRCRCVTRQPVVLPPAAMCKHSTKICGEEKRCLLTGYPIWGSWEHPYSKPTSSAKHRNSLVPERLKTEPMPRSSPSFLVCPFWSSGWLHKQVSILSLSLSLWCTLVGPGMSITSRSSLPPRVWHALPDYSSLSCRGSSVHGLPVPGDACTHGAEELSWLACLSG